MTLCREHMPAEDAQGERPALRISYDARLDLLTALVPGAAVDQPFDEQLMTAFAWREDDESDEAYERAWFFHHHPTGPLIGFGVDGAFAWDLAGEALDAPVWATPRFDVPSLALRNATVGEIVLAAQRMLTGPTPDSIEFDLAVEAGMSGDRETAERHWRACLACGEMAAHYGLGYTLVELGRPHEAFGHLAMYTEICPRNAWAWVWRGRAAQRMGETAEARRSYRTALACEIAGFGETDAAGRLADLDTQTADDRGATMTGTLPQPPTILTARFSEAFEYARAHHTDQLRKGTNIPYLAHLLAVSALVLEHGGDETAAVAALLHDVVEDGGGERALAEIGERFGPRSPRSSRAAATPPRTSRRTGRCASAATSSTSRPRRPRRCSSRAPTSCTTRVRSWATCASTATSCGRASTAAPASSSGTTAHCATSSCAACRADWPTSSTRPCARSSARSTPRTRMAGLSSRSGRPARESGAFIDGPARSCREPARGRVRATSAAAAGSTTRRPRGQIAARRRGSST